MAESGGRPRGHAGRRTGPAGAPLRASALQPPPPPAVAAAAGLQPPVGRPETLAVVRLAPMACLVHVPGTRPSEVHVGGKSGQARPGSSLRQAGVAAVSVASFIPIRRPSSSAKAGPRALKTSSPSLTYRQTSSSPRRPRAHCAGAGSLSARPCRRLPGNGPPPPPAGPSAIRPLEPAHATQRPGIGSPTRSVPLLPLAPTSHHIHPLLRVGPRAAAPRRHPQRPLVPHAPAKRRLARPLCQMTIDLGTAPWDHLAPSPPAGA